MRYILNQFKLEQKPPLDNFKSMQESKRVLISDIAKVAGVSKATVSLALRNNPLVAKKTRDRVMRLANEMSYVPDPALTALASYRALKKPPSDYNVIPFLSFHSSEVHFKIDPYVQELFQGVSDAAHKFGYRAEYFWAKPFKHERLSHILSARGIRGIILAPLPTPIVRIKLDFGKFCAVSTSLSIFKPDLNYASPDQQTGMFLMCHHLRHLKYQKPGLFLTEAVHRRSRHRWLSTYLLEKEFFDYSKVPPLIEKEGSQLNQKFTIWFQKHKPDVIITTYHSLVHKLLRSMKIDVPGEVGIASLDASRTNTPFYSGIYQNPHGVGRCAMDLLHTMMLHQENGIPSERKGILIDPSWIEGKSLRFL